MLVLKRSAKEQISVGPDIKITVVKIQGSKVLIGIEAPMELLILRDNAKPRASDPRAEREEGC